MKPDVVVALGSDLAGEWPSVAALLEAALDGLAGVGLPLLRRSRLWRSAAWPDPSEPAYLNAVALVEAGEGPSATLGALQALEQRFGRTSGRRNAPRTLDLDLIAYGDRVTEVAKLILPHPRAHERLFVMGPLAEIAPEWRHPLLKRTATELSETATVGCDARPL